MPKDKAGNYHSNSQRAAAADNMPPRKPPSVASASTPHGGVPEHLAALHSEMGGKHMHVHSDGMEHTTHHVGDDGQVQGPHSHESMEAVKNHIDQVFDETGEYPELATGHKDTY